MGEELLKSEFDKVENINNAKHGKTVIKDSDKLMLYPCFYNLSIFPFSRSKPLEIELATQKLQVGGQVTIQDPDLPQQIKECFIQIRKFFLILKNKW